MEAALLASGEGWHVHDLMRAASLLGATLERVDFRSLEGRVGMPGGAIRQRHVLVRGMPKGSLEQVVFRMDVLGRLEAGGVRVLNRPRALEAAIDKYLATTRLDAAGLLVPATFVCERAADAIATLESCDALGGEAVVKPLFGSEGKGIFRVSPDEPGRARLRALEAEGAVIHLQRFVDHPGHDFRVFVLGGRVLCAMRRTAPDGWITNVARGASVEAVRPSTEVEAIAMRAAEAVGAECAGVDILPDRHGRLFVLEVNGVPGWRALAAVTGVDVAAEVLGYLFRG